MWRRRGYRFRKIISKMACSQPDIKSLTLSANRLRPLVRKARALEANRRGKRYCKTLTKALLTGQTPITCLFTA
jgi:hypothetical protein